MGARVCILWINPPTQDSSHPQDSYIWLSFINICVLIYTHTFSWWLAGICSKPFGESGPSKRPLEYRYISVSGPPKSVAKEWSLFFFPKHSHKHDPSGIALIGSMENTNLSFKQINHSSIDTIFPIKSVRRITPWKFPNLEAFIFHHPPPTSVRWINEGLKVDVGRPWT